MEILNANLKYQSIYRKTNSRFWERLKALEVGGDNNMNNPWKDISLSDYENHMAMDSVQQLQAMNQMMKGQLNQYDVQSAMILGIAGGNGLEHVDTEKEGE